MIVTLVLLALINIILYQFMGNLIFVIQIIGLIVFGIWLWFKKYRPVIDSVSAFTGAPGTGKTKLMTDHALMKYRVAYSKWKFKNRFTKKVNRIAPPVLVSNYPIVVGRLTKKEYQERLTLKKQKVKNEILLSNPDMPVEDLELILKKVKVTNKRFSMSLTPEIVLLQSKLPNGSVIAISEFGSLISNQDWDNLFVKVNVDEWARFIRQYTKGGYLFVDDQSSDNIEVHIRRRIGKVYNMQSMRKIPFLKIGISNIRHMSISEDIKVIEQGQSENIKNNTSWIPVFFWKKTYDTHAFSNRVKDTPLANLKPFQDFKTNEIISIPYTKKKELHVPPKVNNRD